ncbi:MAG: HTH-type transcriptional regulator NorG [Herbaspirillum frisingense]|uniref:HTH-type transcriptional regulator NorG n=1 Tax=Herbaspirillum frisingense TaxID=92645 RepID=A0A7V8FSP0_9BURK|nr:MAG: HTH-type transcriptional regulator NorG [Herbaspirillum frisingense]
MSPAAGDSLPLVRLAKSAEQSLVEQIVRQMRQLIDDGIVRQGGRAMSIRCFARSHKVSAHTATEAYEQLVAQGYLQARPRSGFFIAGPQATPDAGDQGTAGGMPAWSPHSHLGSHGLLDIGSARLPPGWLDPELIKAGLKALAGRADSELARYGDPYGYAPLRALLQTRLLELGMQARLGQILLAGGATQALEWLVRCLLEPGQRVLVEDPGHPHLFNLLRLHGVRPIAVPRNADGSDLGLLDALARQHRPVMMFVQSMLHAPTGSCLSPANAHALLGLAERHGFRIVENDVYGDLLGTPMPRLATLDQFHRVFYVGGFSKTMSPAARVGFIAGGVQDIAALCRLKMASCISGSQIDERLVFHILAHGRYRRSLDRLRRRLDEARHNVIEPLVAHGMELFCRPLGGHWLWLRHPRFADSQEIVRRAAHAGLTIEPGKNFRDQPQATPWFALNAARLDASSLRGLLRALAV